MKNLVIGMIILSSFILFTCKKDDVSERFKLLTGPVWVSDSLLANGVDGSGPGGVLEKFKGEAKFNTDGTGIFGVYSGTWKFAYNETEIIIRSDSLQIPVNAQIVDLTEVSLKITTGYPNLKIRMTFKTE